MGNRAVITTEKKELGIYLHWNGGRDSVEAFLKYCELKGYRSPSEDSYGLTSLINVIANFFGNGLSCGIGLYKNMDTDNGDNGVYIIKDWTIVGREFAPKTEQLSEDLRGDLIAINDCQPKDSQIEIPAEVTL